MRAPRRIKIPTCALVGVIASVDELRLATGMRAPPDLFELRLDHLPNLRESQLLKLRRPFIITARHPVEGGKKVRSARRDLLLKFLPQAEFVRFMISSAPLNLRFCIKNCSVPAKPAPMCSKLSLALKTFMICSLYSSCCGASLRECAYALWHQANSGQSRACFFATPVRR